MIPAVGKYRSGGGGGTPTAMDAYLAGMLHCYALKQMLGAYAGPLIRVRRSSDDAEQDIGIVSGGLDTTSLASFVGSDSAFVTTWYDQKLSLDAVQTTHSAQPKIVNAGTYLGRIEFDGVDDYLVSHTTAVTALSFAMECSLITTPSGTNVSASYFAHPLLNTTGVNAVTVQWQSSDNFLCFYVFTGTSSFDQIRGTFTLNTNQKLMWVADRTSYPETFYINGGSAVFDHNVSGTPSSAAFTDQDLNIGTFSSGVQQANIGAESFIVWTTNQSANHSGINSAM